MIYPVVQKVTLKGLVGFENNFNGTIIFVSKLLSNVLNNFCAIPWQQCAAEYGCYLRYLPQKVLWEGTKIFVFWGTYLVNIFLNNLPVKQIWRKSAVLCGCYLRYLPQKVLWEVTKICPYLVYAHQLVLPSGGPIDDPGNDRRHLQGLEVHVLFDAILDPKK